MAEREVPVMVILETKVVLDVEDDADEERQLREMARNWRLAPEGFALAVRGADIVWLNVKRYEAKGDVVQGGWRG
jgi:hypothetical protein